MADTPVGVEEAVKRAKEVCYTK